MVDEYDSPWKEAIERYFSDFMHFFFPAAHAKINWSRPVDFLEQELRSVVSNAEVGKRFVEKLARVSLSDGSLEWVYVHLEVQGAAQSTFAERMFVYNYRLFDRYHLPIASLAVLADDQASWRPESYGYQVLDCEMGIRFPVAKLLDWAGSEAKLEDSTNPFAVVTSAHLATRSTRHDPHARYQAKLRLVRSLYRRGWDRQRVVDLFQVLDWMMRLPDELETKFQQDLESMEEETTMRFVSSLEKLAIKKGMEQGMEQGMQQGMQQGRVEGGLYILRQLLERRFGPLPAWAESRLTTATQPDIEAWTATFIGANSIEEVLGSVPASDNRSAN